MKTIVKKQSIKAFAKQLVYIENYIENLLQAPAGEQYTHREFGSSLRFTLFRLLLTSFSGSKKIIEKVYIEDCKQKQ
ncbi:MAG: hypothetical protein QXT19_00960 [Candidatus Woesearchaeota archaeon]